MAKQTSHDASPEKVGRVRTARRPKRPLWRRLLLVAGVLVFVVGLAGAAGLAWVLKTYGGDVPDIAWAVNYRPPIVSDALSGDDQLLGEFYNERRRVVPYERMPKKLVQAFIAAEDARFFDHGGLDLFGIARTATKNLLAGRIKGGASTLTQQTAKAILISTWGFERATARTFERKIPEALLALELEQGFTKEEILAIYLNQVYLGHSSYGVQAAAENYFRKNVWDLSLAEISLLAGLPQAPSRYSPFRFPDRAKARRRYVLRRMLEEGMITQRDHDEAAAAEVVTYPVEDVFRETAPFVTEHVRRDIVQRYGNDRLLNDGLKIYATVDLDLEREAIAASLAGLSAADKRQGYRGPLANLDPKVQGDREEKARTELGDKAPAPVHLPLKSKTLAERTQEFRRIQREKGAAPGDVSGLDPETTYVAVVLSVKKDEATVGVGDRIEGVIPLSEMRWARKPNPMQSFKWTQLGSVPEALSAGDVILVRALPADPKKAKKDDERVRFTLEQEASLQGALVSLDPKSGYIVAMIGGYDFNKSEFNRAFQACRQPGSAFKPLVYSAAIENLGWTVSTPILDAPIVYDDPENAVRWKPSNYDMQFRGDVTLREALVHSLNTPAVRVLEAVGPRDAAAWANRLGITSKLNEDLSIALGSSCVTLWDMTHAYAVFNQHGRRVTSTFIRRIVDRDGRVLEDHSAYYDPWISLRNRLASGYAELFRAREQVIEPETAFITTNLMKEVCRSGTGARASALGRHVAGKTGTTNDAFDAWFMGFSPELVTGVWVGYDTYEMPMGRYETGGHTALPIWMDFMAAALKGRPVRDFSAPEGITWASIDPQTGRLADERTPSRVLAPYKTGTEPTPEAEAAAEQFDTGADFLRTDGL